MGREYEVVLDGSVPKGEYSYMVDLGNLSPGVYVAMLKRIDKNIATKIVVQ
jgi:hypothetical protein